MNEGEKKVYAKPLTPLTIKAILKDAKAAGSVIKAPDGKGLYFVADPGEGRSSWWHFDYRVGGKQKTLSLGTYPDVQLPDTRDQRDELRKAIRQGIDPGAQAGKDSFEPIAREWVGAQPPPLDRRPRCPRAGAAGSGHVPVSGQGADPHDYRARLAGVHPPH